MSRRLGAFESALALSDAHAPLNVVAVLCLAAGPSPDALRRALEALQRRHPLLRARIVDRGGRYFFDRGRGVPIALRRAERDGSAAWMREAETELNDRLDVAGGPPLRAVYLAADGGECEILLTLHHAVMDAASAVALCRELLAACAAADAGRAPEIGEPLALLPPAEALFPPAFRKRRRWTVGRFLWRQLRAEIADRRRARGAWHPPPAATRSRILSFQLTEAETASLARRARGRRLTLHSIFDAAMLLAVARHLYPGHGRTRGRGLPLRHLVFANLRPYLVPPVAEENLGAYFAMLRFSSRLWPERDLWDLAREIGGEVHAGAKRGEKYAYSLTSAAVMDHLIRSGRQRMAATAISYIGAARLAPESRFPVTALHAFVSNFRLGPEYTAQVRLYAGRIWWDILYLEPELDRDAAGRVAAEIRNLLVSEEASP